MNGMVPLLGLAATGAVVAVGNTLGRRRRQTLGFPSSHASESPVPMPHLGAFKLERLSRPCVRWLFVALIVVVPIAAQNQRPLLTGLATAILIMLVACAVGGLALDFVLRCRACGWKMLLESADSAPFFNVEDHRRKVLHDSYQCMYCGQRYVVSSDTPET
jgi:hypothetical protein